MPDRRLRYAVHGIVDLDGTEHVFVPGDDIPDWALTQITNPNCWEGGVLPELSEEKPARRARPK